MTYIAEPFKIAMVEPLRTTTRPEREAAIEAAGFNVFGLASDDVYIDLLTDSGTGALSNRQWSAMMVGDEAYSGGRSYRHLMDVAHGIFDYDYIQPVHQGRAAEKVLFPLLVKPASRAPRGASVGEATLRVSTSASRAPRGASVGEAELPRFTAEHYVLSNTLFDTTRGHVVLAGGRPVDLLCPEGKDPATYADFKGNIDIPALVQFIEDHGAASVAAIVMTLTNNAVGGQPVSVANLRETAAIAHRHGIPLIIDAARFAENAHFVKLREPEFATASIAEITRATFALADVFTMSAKKDAIVSMGGLIAVRNNPHLVAQIKAAVVPSEGFLTYGGLTGRDLEAMAVGLTEGMAEDYLAYRIGQSQYLADRLAAAGIGFQNPVGGHGVFVDAAALLPHIPWYEFPGHALAIELYREAGIRCCDVGSFLLDPDPATGEPQRAPCEFTRLAIPRRVYTQAHLDVVADALIAIRGRAAAVPGYEIVASVSVLRHFTAALRPLRAGNRG
jgi:tryptophanase